MTEETPATTGQLSPDGYWWWNGSQWVSAISDDGRWRWDGRGWIPNEAGVRTIGPFRYEATEDTRRLQIAVITFLVISAIYALVSLPPTMRASMEASLQNSPGLDPSVIDGMITGITVFVIAATLVWEGVLITGTVLLWRWIFYLQMVLGGLGAFSILTDVAGLAGYGTSAKLPAWALIASIVFSLVGLGLGIWLFTLWRRYHSAWARRAIPI